MTYFSRKNRCPLTVYLRMDFKLTIFSDYI